MSLGLVERILIAGLIAAAAYFIVIFIAPFGRAPVRPSDKAGPSGIAIAYGLGPRRFHVVNWTLVWVFAIGLVLLFLFIYLAKSEQWGTVVTGSLVPSKINTRINRAVKYPLLPTGRPEGDGYIADAQPPLSIKSLADGGVEVTFPASIGWYRTGLQHRWSDGPLQVDVVDSTFFWLTDSGKRINRSVGGWPFYQLPKESPQVLLQADYIKADLPQGGLLLRQGRAQPHFVGAGRHIVALQQRLSQENLPDSDAEIFLAINVPQMDGNNSGRGYQRSMDMRRYLEGTITVRLTPINEAADR